eukprot:60398-Lingulodinium_polyedra.AAC.1
MLYCESRQLSVPRVGMPYVSAPYDADVPTLSKHDLAGILATRSLFYDLDSHDPKGAARGPSGGRRPT